jgi:hypothetical protein
MDKETGPSAIPTARTAPQRSGTSTRLVVARRNAGPPDHPLLDVAQHDDEHDKKHRERQDGVDHDGPSESAATMSFPRLPFGPRSAWERASSSSGAL